MRTTVVALVVLCSLNSRAAAQEPDKVVADLVKLLDDPKEGPASKLSAVKALGGLGARAQSALPAMARTGQYLAGRGLPEDIRYVDAAIQNVAKPGPVRTVPEYLDNLKHKDAHVRLSAIKFFADLSAAALPTMASATRDSDEDVRLLAARSIDKARAAVRQAEPSVAVLVADLKNTDESVRLKAAKVLARLGPRASAAVPALTEALKDADEDVRRVAEKALARINPKK
jgi:HEAT repeat protein